MTQVKAIDIVDKLAEAQEKAAILGDFFEGTSQDGVCLIREMTASGLIAFCETLENDLGALGKQLYTILHEGESKDD